MSIDTARKEPDPSMKRIYPPWMIFKDEEVKDELASERL